MQSDLAGSTACGWIWPDLLGSGPTRLDAAGSCRTPKHPARFGWITVHAPQHHAAHSQHPCLSNTSTLSAEGDVRIPKCTLSQGRGEGGSGRIQRDPAASAWIQLHIFSSNLYGVAIERATRGRRRPAKPPEAAGDHLPYGRVLQF